MPLEVPAVEEGQEPKIYTLAKVCRAFFALLITTQVTPWRLRVRPEEGDETH